MLSLVGAVRFGGVHVVIARRFCGRPGSGQGGYTCGLVAGLVGGVAGVTLRRPPPLDLPLAVRRARDRRVELWEGETLVAEGKRADLEMAHLVVPAPVTFDEAESARPRDEELARHAFRTCFGCGPDRAEGDGLRLFAGRVPGRDVVAAPWVPAGSLAGEDGAVRPEIVWAALDCPSGWAVAERGRPTLLGRMTGHLTDLVKPGRPYVVMGWPVRVEGRKLDSGSAIVDATGRVMAAARVRWIVPRGARPATPPGD